MNETARDFLARCFAPGATIALLLRTESPAKTQQRVVTLEQALAPRYLGWLAHENHRRSEHLCRRQSASPRQPEAHQGEHRFRPPSVYRHRHGWRCPARCAPGIGCWCRRRPRSSPHPPASIRCFGASKASTSRVRNRRSSCSPSPSAAIPLAPTATVSFASPVS